MRQLLAAGTVAGLVFGASCTGADPTGKGWDPEVGRKAKLARVLELGGLSSPESVALLAEATRDPLEEIRVEAVRSLGKTGHPDALPILDELSRSEFRGIRTSVAWALGRHGHPDGVKTLAGLITDQEKVVRSQALGAYSLLDNHDATPTLAKAAVSEPDPDLRDRIIQVLSDWKDPRAVPLLERALQSETDDIRGHAAGALANMADPSCAPALIGALEDPSAVVRGAAALSLSRLEVAESLPILRKSAEAEPDDLARATMAWSIGALAEKGGEDRGWAIGQLETILTTRMESDFARAQAAKALGELNSCGSLPVLKRAVNDRKGIVVNAVSNALKELEC